MWIKFLPNFTFKKTFMVPFLWMGFNCLKVTEPLRVEKVTFTTRSPGVPGTHLVDLGRMIVWLYLGATQWFWTKDPCIGNPVPEPLGHFQTIIFKKAEIFQISYGFPALRVYQNLTNYYSHKRKTKNKVFPVHFNFNFCK